MNQPRPFSAAAGRASVIAAEFEQHLMRRYARATPQEITMAMMTVVKKMDIAEAKRRKVDPNSIRPMQDFAILLAGGLQAVNFNELGKLQGKIEGDDVLGGGGDDGLVMTSGL